MITKLIFLLSESFRALFRAKLPAAISSITIAITLVIFSLAYFTYENLLSYSYKFKSKYRIEVFFQSDLKNNEARDLFNTILITDGIEQGEFINKEKAANLFKSYDTYFFDGLYYFYFNIIVDPCFSSMIILFLKFIVFS